jgi:hypothetical protein
MRLHAPTARHRRITRFEGASDGQSWLRWNEKCARTLVSLLNFSVCHYALFGKLSLAR